MKTRERVCEFYLNEGNCSKGREGTFYQGCQHCSLYRPLPGSKPNRVDRRRHKLEKIYQKERNDY